MAKGSVGRIVQILGNVVDVEFPPEELPDIYNAFEGPRDGHRRVLEVQQLLAGGTVRCFAMDTTDGLRRGMVAYDTGGSDHGAGWGGHPGPGIQRAGRANR